MTRWPWITLTLVVLVLVSPLGQEVYSGLHSGEQLARSMSRIIIMIYGPILLALVAIEWGIRVFLRARRNARSSEHARSPTET
jgi:hypothetical protein